MPIIKIYYALHHVAPKPRAPLPSEKTYLTTSPDGTTPARQLPCWYDAWLAERRLSEHRQPELGKFHIPDAGTIEAPEVLVSVVVPAYNEEERISLALEEAVEYLDATFGRRGHSKADGIPGAHKRALRGCAPPGVSGYEIVVVSDGSRDRTVDVVLEFARKKKLHDVLRVVKLEKNRGKGGAVTHGFRHVRGEYVLFADADGASKFSDLGKLMEGCEEVSDGSHRGVAVGSRAHLVGSEAVVQVRFPSSSTHVPPEVNPTDKTPALGSPQLPHARLPLRPHDPHAARHVAHQGHAVRLQALLARRAPARGALHACRGMDLRRGDVDACRVGARYDGAGRRW